MKRPPLIVLRGNSGSGKSSVARALRQRYGYGLAWVEQDYLRRVLLREHDIPDGHNIRLIETNVRYCLDAGYVTVLEGILQSRHYAPMLERLHSDFGGHWYYFDLSFEETVRRHAARPQAAEFGAEQMSQWYQERDVLPFAAEQIIGPESSLEETADRIARQAFGERQLG
ncbi:kinase [Deinococcus sp. Marseille-Q6407]|uniref:kinase n=1 Tax=Deinococcus sp. Marseille-Q6407 TaxID=2969223 RepID=UPI0021C03F5A|nr:kinase [Deinococcus sp. Marseille-Q6407]